MGRLEMRHAGRRAWSLSVHLLVLCLAILGPGIVLGGLALWNLFAAERASTEVRLLQAVQDIANALDREVQGYARIGESLAASPLLQSRNFEAFDLQVRQLLGLHGWHVILSDRSGQQVVNTTLPAGSPLPRDGVERLRDVIQSGKPRVSNLFYAAGKMPLVGVRVPVISGGETAYVLTIAVPAEVLTPLLDQKIGDLSWTVEIADRSSRVIARSHEHAENVGRQAPASSFEQLEMNAPVYRDAGPDGREVVRVVDQAQLSGWVVGATVLGSEMVAVARQGWWTFAALGLALTGLSIALAYLFARRIARPIEHLASIPLDGMAAGFQETGLAEANQVGAALIESIADLEASEERYRTLVEAANDIIYTMDLDGRFLTCNAAAYKTLGYRGDELVGRPLSSLIATGKQRPLDELLPSAGGQRRTRVEIEVTARSGRTLIWDVNSRLLRDRDGRPVSVLSIARDITGRKRAEEQLRANEERLRLALAGIGAGVWEYDFTTRSSTWSPEMMELYGVAGRTKPPSRAELLGLIHPEDRERIRTGAQQQVMRGGPFTAEFRVQRPDGRLAWISSRGAVELGAGGRAVRARGIDQDVTAARTAQVQREQLLRTTAEQLNEVQSLYNSAPIGLALVDPDFRFQRVNQVLAEMTGHSVEEHLGKLTSELVPDFMPVVEPLLRQVVETGEPVTDVEIAGETSAKPGVLRSWVQQFYPLKSPDGTVIGIGIICEEVTERRRAQLEQAHLAAIVESSADAIMSLSMDARLRSWNPSAERMFGYSAAEITGKPASLLVPPGSSEPTEIIAKPGGPAVPRGPGETTLAFFDRAAAGESLTGEALRRRKDGTDVPVSISASPMRDSKGRTVAVSVIFRDISEQKRREEHTRFIMRELSHRSKNLLAVIQAMARQTVRTSRDLDDFQERFTARVKGLSQSHDLLVKRNWRGVPVADLVRAHLTAFVDRAEHRLDLSGPSLSLKPEAAQNIGLALHELATNASKHGALSSPTGRIAIWWGTEERDGERRFRMSWRESGGPQVEAPRQRGFGHTVVEAMVGRALEGEARLEWLPEGLAWHLDVPAASASTGSDTASAAEFLPDALVELQAVYSAWLQLSSGRGGLPSLDALDIDSIPGAESIFVAAVRPGSDPVEFRYERIGGRLAEMFGRPDRGEPLGKRGERVMGSLQGCYREATASGLPCYDSARFGRDGERPLEFERLLLPFSENGKSVSHVLGMAVFENAA
ncbi:MAG: PAS domain S-box protein [Hyphomicrobiaceae bacterium]|nr:PAS domain S-box protein [Hyphomicrobiaceae bacterium]